MRRKDFGGMQRTYLRKAATELDVPQSQSIEEFREACTLVVRKKRVQPSLSAWMARSARGCKDHSENPEFESKEVVPANQKLHSTFLFNTGNSKGRGHRFRQVAGQPLKLPKVSL